MADVTELCPIDVDIGTVEDDLLIDIYVGDCSRLVGSIPFVEQEGSLREAGLYGVVSGDGDIPIGAAYIERILPGEARAEGLGRTSCYLLAIDSPD